MKKYFFVLFSLILIPFAQVSFGETYDINMPTGSASPDAPFFWQNEKTGEPTGDITIKVGDTVVWKNGDTSKHTITSGTLEDGPDGIFGGSKFLVPGEFYKFTFKEKGSYPYFCLIHPWMTGVIIVQEEGAKEHEDEHNDEHEDEEMHMDDDKMMAMEGDATATGMLSDGTEVSIWTSAPTADEMMEINVVFHDSEHVNHDIKVTQSGNTVLDDMGAHHHEGKGSHMTQALDSSDPVDVTITFQGYGIDEKTGPIGEVVVFSNVVPEFGTIAMMILAVSIISIIAVTAKSRVIPRL